MSKTATHYLPNGKPYTGPVHKEGGMLMTGAKHTATTLLAMVVCKNLTHTPPKKAKK